MLLFAWVVFGCCALAVAPYRLPYPSGTASGMMIQSLHSEVSLGDMLQANLCSLACLQQGQNHVQRFIIAIITFATCTPLPFAPSMITPAVVCPSCPCCALLTSPPLLLDLITHQSGAAVAKKKVRLLAYTAVGSFAFDLFKWFFQGADYSCGFVVWPNLGLQALGECNHC